MNENVGDLEKLSINQAKAIELMLIGSKTSEIAKDLNVDTNTIYRWKANPLFKTTLQHRLNDITENSINRIKLLSSKSLYILEDLIENSDNDSIKMRSAMFVIDKLMILNQEDVFERINNIEMLLRGLQRK